MSARFLVGIDLGTTNTACAYVDTRAGTGIRVFDIPQLVAPGRVEPRPTLPSFVYLAGAHDLPAGSLDLPWATGRDFCVGWLARDQGARVPGRLVSSAKSWLCHGGVDRTAAILPWGAGDDVAKISPVDASARILRHLRDAWDATLPEPLAAQDVVLTVPASFDEVARELTIEAARIAGLPDVVLLEEPQAAFYSWIVAHEHDWRARVTAHPTILVVDVGGGTTDVSLIAARQGRGELALERIAVGDHLLLGGDNMDMALARAVEVRIGTLDTQRFHGLVSQCRAAKERLLDGGDEQQVRLTVPGRGGSVIGGALHGDLARDEVTSIVLDGFFPQVTADARPRRATGAGLREFGLPFASDPEITRHVADFLGRQREAAGETERELVRPDAILFNGGACEPDVVRTRIADAIAAWHAGGDAWRPAVLEGVSLQLAVARGAAYFGRVRRGQGVRIGSGAARTYYLGLDADTALCLVPRGMEEGETSVIEGHDLELLTNRPVAFPLFTATDRSGETAGALVPIVPDELRALPPIRTVLRFGRKLEERALPVQIEARLTEIGTLEVWCRSRETEHRWRLEFRLRDTVGAEAPPPEAAAGLVIDAARIDAAAQVLRGAFEGSDDPVTLGRRLETALDAARDAWSLAAIRALWDVLWTLEPARARTAEHEARWLNLAGFLLRPGFGDTGDDVRVNRLWRVLGADLRNPRAVQCRAEWWNLWKRVAGGLNARQQQHLLAQVSPALVRKGKAKGPRPGPQELREMWQAIGSCERLAAAQRAELTATLVADAVRGRTTDQELWALARLGARVPVYGPLNCVIARTAATDAAEKLLGAEWTRPGATAFALSQIARATGDRERDLEPALRERVAVRLESVPDGARAARIVREAVALEAREEARLLDESLPAGLRLRT
ncbi:MAG TPA: Hsp70 family protein [Candidatus Binatia bacterium]|jgi:molecular chaperone DnaK (HSP70)|nr:Hsp70 family protein [Candidatus Binatia bacterium]